MPSPRIVATKASHQEAVKSMEFVSRLVGLGTIGGTRYNEQLDGELIGVDRCEAKNSKEAGLEPYSRVCLEKQVAI